MKARIYHNPRCSKSRATLALLEERGVTLEIVEYLREPPSRATLARLLDELGDAASELVRTSEPEYAELARRHPQPTRDQLLDLLVAHPHLMQRPIVEVGKRAAIGRPPERVLDLLR
ncbi:MAG TPA: arsenate reductase (glutaredoxin) [Gammaproteobacteria bacterium]|nr:arsenate reductase (glutaredoxin) [Gammaproteobacteria bacterium]